MKKRLPNTTFYLDTNDFDFVSTPTETNIEVSNRFVTCATRNGGGDFTQNLEGVYNFNNTIELTGDGVEEGYTDTFKLYVDEVQSYWFSTVRNSAIKSVGNALVLESTFDHNNMKYYEASVDIDASDHVIITSDWMELNKESLVIDMADLSYKVKNFWAWDIFTPFLQNSASFSSLLFKLNTTGFDLSEPGPAREREISIYGTSISPMDVSSYYLKLFNLTRFLTQDDPTYQSVLIDDPSYTPEVCAGIYAMDTCYEPSAAEETERKPVILFSSRFPNYLSLLGGELKGDAYLSCLGFFSDAKTRSLTPHSYKESNVEVPHYDIGDPTYRYNNLYAKNVNTDIVYFYNDTTSAKPIVTYINHSEDTSTGGAGNDVDSYAVSKVKLYTKSNLAEKEASIELESYYLDNIIGIPPQEEHNYTKYSKITLTAENTETSGDSKVNGELTVIGGINGLLKTLYSDDIGGLFRISSLRVNIWCVGSPTTDIWNAAKTQFQPIFRKRGIELKIGDELSREFVTVGSNSVVLYTNISYMNVDSDRNIDNQKFKILGGLIYISNSHWIDLPVAPTFEDPYETTELLKKDVIGDSSLGYYTDLLVIRIS